MSQDKLLGYDCEFKTHPPSRSRCPVCLLIIRDPHQALCCGKSFCKECILTLKSSPCPTCKYERLDSFPDKGLQQELCSLTVFCTYRYEGCEWSGELGQLDQHLNLTPSKSSVLLGCAFIDVICSYCNVPCKRGKLEEHQASECSLRPFTCQFCKTYTSTFEGVKDSHELICECRPVECPNSCETSNLQHQHLEEHVSSQCPLSKVLCVLNDVGCKTELYRKDLHSHIINGIAAHMSLLASENKK